MSSIPPPIAIQAVNKVFKVWGLPKRIKIDNGWPFIHSGHLNNPTLSILWWIGLGIEVIQNHPGCPQQNGTVEGLQNICYRWVNPAKYNSVEELQQAIDQTCFIQRSVYRITTKNYATRSELYPELEGNSRTFDPANFQMQRVWSYLSKQVWKRLIKSNGSISFIDHEIYISQKMAGQTITATFDPVEKLWLIHSVSGQFLKSSNKQIFTKNQILMHAGISKN